MIELHIFCKYKQKIENKCAKIEKDIETTISKEKAEELKNLIREEMQNAINKENYIKPEDALIINQFIEKVKNYD